MILNGSRTTRCHLRMRHFPVVEKKNKNKGGSWRGSSSFPGSAAAAETVLRRLCLILPVIRLLPYLEY